MSFIRKYSGDTKALIAAEYECPEHGRFEITVPRDAVADVEICGLHTGIFCGRESPWRFPSPMTRVQRVTAARKGKDPEAPPGAFDWRSLAEGQDHEEWEAKERKKDLDYVHNSVKKQVVG